jgi:tRNA A37 threonylcarbamoyladenosine dehydratase
VVNFFYHKGTLRTHEVTQSKNIIKVDKWLSRTELLLGKEKLKKLKSSNVLIVGLGGVGAFAAEMLCRAGIGSMTIVDGDTVHASNRNRQLLALKSTEGKSKAEIMQKRLLDINPGLKLDEGFDYVVDAIDTLSPKVFLIYHSLQRKYPVVSSMGSGGKYDPLRIDIKDISETTDCPLARILRKRLHRLGVREGFTAVYSPEAPDKAKVIPVSGEPNKASVVGTISYMPAAFGIACASVVIRDLTGVSR